MPTPDGEGWQASAPEQQRNEVEDEEYLQALGEGLFTENPTQDARGRLRARLRTAAVQAAAGEAKETSQALYGIPYAPLPPDPPQAVWRIWSNVHKKWFLPGARGYTASIEEAGRFMPMEALQIYEHSSRGWDPHHPFPITVTLVPA